VSNAAASRDPQFLVRAKTAPDAIRPRPRGRRLRAGAAVPPDFTDAQRELYKKSDLRCIPVPVSVQSYVAWSVHPSSHQAAQFDNCRVPTMPDMKLPVPLEKHCSASTARPASRAAQRIGGQVREGADRGADRIGRGRGAGAHDA
jgi:hypothetical protein